MKRFAIDFWVGLFVLIGIGCLVFLSLKVATTTNFGNASTETYTLYASFNNIGSLKIAAPVKVSGFVVGRISNIQLNPKNYQAVVTIEVNANYKFTTDTAAQILTTGLLGEQYIDLQSGSDSQYLKDGGTITLTSSAMVLEQLIGKFMTNMSPKN